MLVAGAASAQSSLDAMELDVMDADERPDEALKRASVRAQQQADEDPQEHKLLRIDWSLGGPDDATSTAPLTRLVEDSGPTEPIVLTDVDDRGHGRDQAREPDKHEGRGRGHKDDRGRDRDRDRKGDRERERDRDDKDEDDDKDEGRKGRGEGDKKKGRD